VTPKIDDMHKQIFCIADKSIYKKHMTPEQYMKYAGTGGTEPPFSSKNTTTTITARTRASTNASAAAISYSLPT
jgi:hypothetical protein